MAVKKTVLRIISWAILIFLVVGLWRAARHPKTVGAKTTLEDKVRTAYDDFLDSITVSRKPPLTTIELEVNLKKNLSVPFVNFDQDTWKWFWHLLYGRFPDDSRGWLGNRRQLTRQEVQDELIYYHGKPFGNFKERHWAIFWQHILKGKVFK